MVAFDDHAPAWELLKTFKLNIMRAGIKQKRVRT
jgi:hypothetical protein